MGKKKLFIGIFSAALFLSFYSQPSFSSSACDARSIRNLEVIKNYAERKGFSCRDHAHGKYLPNNGKYVIRTTLLSGRTYLLVGVGNENVKDLDLYLFDENENLISRDKSSDASPIVEVTPSWTGRYYVVGHMYTGKGCSNVMVCSQ